MQTVLYSPMEEVYLFVQNLIGMEIITCLMD